MRIQRKPRSKRFSFGLARRVAVVVALASLSVAGSLSMLGQPQAQPRAAVVAEEGSRPPSHHRCDLRVDWLRLSPRSEIARRLQRHQRNCSLPFRIYPWRSGAFGLGSDLHAWGNALWHGLNGNFRIKSPSPWVWADQKLCRPPEPPADEQSSSSSTSSPPSLSCYFLDAEPFCPSDNERQGAVAAPPRKKTRRAAAAAGDEAWKPCGKDWSIQDYSIPDFRAAAAEYAFSSSLSPLVVDEARRQASLVLSSSSSSSSPNQRHVSSDRLITVHVRWGDKVVEGGGNVAIDEYIQAIETIVEEEELALPIFVLLCTEDPLAVAAFRRLSRSGWHVLLDRFYEEYLPHRQHREVLYNLPSLIANETGGRAGLWALGSLLVALEANFYVLATKSNWSRLVNELRKNVIDPTCGGCTRMVDLAPGEC